MERKILFILEDVHFFESIKEELDGLKKIKIALANNFKTVYNYMEDKNFIFHGFFIDPTAFNKKAIELLKDCHTYHNSVPIFLINNRMDSWVSSLLERPLGIQEAVEDIEKTVEIIKKIEEEMILIMQICNHEEAEGIDPNKDGDKKKDSKNDPFADVDRYLANNYFPVNTQSLICGKKCFFDIYVKVTNRKFVKIVNQLEVIDKNRLQRYLVKGVEHFYVKKVQREYFLKQLDKEVRRLVSQKKVSVSVKTEQILNMGHQVINLIKDSGTLEPESIDFAKQYVGNVVSLIENVKTENVNFKHLLEAMPNYDHASNVAFLVAFIAEKYGIESHRGHEILGLSAFLHDVGLYSPDNKCFTQYKDFDYKIEEEDFKKKSVNQSLRRLEREFFKKVFMEHPIRGGEMLQDIPGINPTCSQIIHQHHMRINESGFPARHGNIHPLSLIVGIGEEFIDAYSKAKLREVNPLIIIEDLEGFPNETKKVISNVFRR